MEKVDNFFFAQNLALLVKNFKVVLVQDFHNFIDLMDMLKCSELTLSSLNAICGLISPTVYGMEISFDFIFKIL